MQDLTTASDSFIVVSGCVVIGWMKARCGLLWLWDLKIRFWLWALKSQLGNCSTDSDIFYSCILTPCSFQSSDGSTPVHLASSYGYMDILDILMKAVAFILDPPPDQDGMLPIHK